MDNLTALPSEDRTFILIDGAKVTNLSETIYREMDNPQCDALYRETELADLLEVSPWLIEADMESALARLFFEEWQTQGVAIVLESRFDFGVVMDHLRGLIKGRLITGDDVVFRFYDPEVMRHLLKRDPAGEDARRLMGPCHRVIIQDRRTGEWEYFHNDQPANSRFTGVFSLREEHQVAMEQAAHQTALRKLELHVAAFFPHLLSQPDKTGEHWEAVSALIKAAKTRGLYSPRDIALYINTIGWLGQGAFECSEVRGMWEGNSASPGKAIARIAEFAERTSMEGHSRG